jgi:hypothetical protein
VEADHVVGQLVDDDLVGLCLAQSKSAWSWLSRQDDLRTLRQLGQGSGRLSDQLLR